jgi:hypothetical protein
MKGQPMTESLPAPDARYTDHGERHPAEAAAICIAAAVGGFAFGFDTSVINGAVTRSRAISPCLGIGSASVIGPT